MQRETDAPSATIIIMELHEDDAGEGRLAPRSIPPLSEIWSVVTSEIGGIITNGESSKTQTQSNHKTTTPVITTMITTEVPVPVSTVTVGTTLLRTSFVTVHLTTSVTRPRPRSTSSCLDGRTCDLSKGVQPTTYSSSKHTSLPRVVTSTHSSPTHTTHTTHTIADRTHTHQPDHASTSTASATASPTPAAMNYQQKQAIIGGLSGSIGGLVVIALLVFLFLRRRRSREENDDSISEKGEGGGIQPAIARLSSRLSSHFTTRNSPQRPILPMSRGSTPDFDGGLIRMPLDHWPRPFAHRESFRESMGPSRLRVMNPDPSRPETPNARNSGESAGTFLKRQRSDFTAMLFGANHSRNNSFVGTPPGSQRGIPAPVPTIAIDAAGSTESLSRPAPTPSFRSYTSVSSRGVEQHPLEDPFLTPPDETEELTPQDESVGQATPKAKRQGIAPLQSAASAATRT